MSPHRFIISTLADMLSGGLLASHELYLDLGDCRIRLCSNSPELVAQLDGYFGSFVAGPGPVDVMLTALEAESPSVPLDLQVKEPDPGKDKIKEEYTDLPGGRLVRKVLTGMVFLFGQDVNLAVGPCGENPNQIVNFINNRYIEHKMNRGCLLGHSAAVAHLKDGRMRGLALAGFSGAGKSTLAMHVMSRGAFFVSNDRLLVRENSTALSMFGVAKLPRINPGTALNNPHLADVVPHEERERFLELEGDDLWDLEHKYDVFLDKCFGDGRFVLSAPMHGLVVLNWQRGAGDSSIRFVKAAERPDLLPAFMKAAGLFYLPPDGADTWSDPGLDAYTALLSRCDLVEITGGVDFDRAADFCMEYLLHG
ncbi:MAG: HprK-related kinase B [Proteobacteria bacterium]|nr:HprK-related kinase B [Pseudomonadota bacterium]MBU1594183.1 HprK-related kinase B [Pseudomonadota bacterium]